MGAGQISKLSVSACSGSEKTIRKDYTLTRGFAM